jgi:hypothetical protein
MLVISVNSSGGRVVCAGEGLSVCDQWAEIDFRYALFSIDSEFFFPFCLHT